MEGGFGRDMGTLLRLRLGRTKRGLLRAVDAALTSDLSVKIEGIVRGAAAGPSDPIEESSGTEIDEDDLERRFAELERTAKRHPPTPSRVGGG